jgi:hypothetical protein
MGLSAFLNAQTENPPAQPADPGFKESTVTVKGCLKEEAAGRFSLAEESATGTTGGTSAGKTYRLSPSAGVDLKTHIGHRIEVTGTKAGKEPTSPTAEHMDPNMLKVTAVKMVSDTCASDK